MSPGPQVILCAVDGASVPSSDIECRVPAVIATDSPPHLYGLLPEDLVAQCAARGVECSITEARRILGHVISNGKPGLAITRSPRRAVTKLIEEAFVRTPLEVVERVQDEFDGFVKFLLKHPDGSLTEAVRIPLEKKGRFTVCLSSQVGCAMRCVFCATGRLGLQRSLAAWEMVAALIAVREDIALDPTLDALRAEGVAPRITGVVFQGQGEPFHNYDEVIQAAKVLSEPCGGRITQEAITISTVGLVPQIERYGREGHPYRLIVSLTSAVESKRKKLLPVAGNFALSELVRVLRAYQHTLGKRVTLAWVLMKDINHTDDEVAALQAAFEGLPIRVNLIDVNDATGEFDVVEDAERIAFVGKLQAAGFATQRRYSGGKNKHAACGMLAATHLSEPRGAAHPSAAHAGPHLPSTDAAQGSA